MIRIETTDTIYSELFTITFLHSGYETPLDKFLSGSISVAPDENTKKIFTEYKMNYRFFANTLVCFIQCALPASDPKTPFMKIDNDIKIRFLIKNSSDFFNKTFVTATANKKIYQFSNKANNVNGGIFLTAPVENYNSAKDYNKGTIVQNGGNLFGTLQTVLAVKNIPLINTDFWEQLTPFEQVVNNADLQDAVVVNPEEDCLGVIDMFKNVATTSYQFFGTNDELINPSFTIKFKSKLKF